MYADDTELYDSRSLADIDSAEERLTNCIEDVAEWSASCRLQLNAGKTQMIWFASHANLAKLE